MTLETALNAMRREFSDLSDKEKQVAQDFLLGFCSGYVPMEKWLEFCHECHTVAMKTRKPAPQYDKGTKID